MKKKSNWSIQISVNTAKQLKQYCNVNGFKMNWLVEHAIHLYISGSLNNHRNLISGSYGK